MSPKRSRRPMLRLPARSMTRSDSFGHGRHGHLQLALGRRHSVGPGPPGEVDDAGVAHEALDLAAGLVQGQLGHAAQSADPSSADA